MTFPLKRVARSTAFALAAVVALSSAGCAFFGEGISIELTQDQLQRIVNAVFPLSGDENAVAVTLSNPAVTMPDGGDRIAFALDISVSVVLEPGEGPVAERAEARAAEVEEAAEPEGRGGRARARARDKAGDARAKAGEAAQERAADREPTVLTGTAGASTGIRYNNDVGALYLDGVNIDRLDIDQLPQRFNEPVTRLVSAAITRALEQTPIYEIDTETTAGGIVDTLVRDLTIENGVLKITIGVG